MTNILTPPKPSWAKLDFTAPGAATFKYSMANVDPMQLLAASAWLERYAHKLLDQAEAEQAENQKIVQKIMGNGASRPQ